MYVARRLVQIISAREERNYIVDAKSYVEQLDRAQQNWPYLRYVDLQPVELMMMNQLSNEFCALSPDLKVMLSNRCLSGFCKFGLRKYAS